MIIKKIEIQGFGKFTDASFNLNQGLNLVYGNNEDGKTTLMSFVKMMLYSSSAKTEKSSDLFKSLRKKYRPWNSSTMSGSIEFEWEGKTYRLQKEFLKSDATDKTSVFCVTTGENIQLPNKNEAGEYFLGMSLDEFERSVFMGQSGGFTADNAADSLAMRISNLSVSGDENVSHEQISKRLYDAKEELVSKSRKKGLLIEAENQLKMLKLKQEQLIELENSQKDTEDKISRLTAEIGSLESDLNSLSDSDKLENAKKDLNAFYTLQNKLNLLKAVKGQLAAYDASYDDLQIYANKAKALNDKIEKNLTLIQEATLHKDFDISDEEYARLLNLDKKCRDIRSDISLLKNRINALWEEFKTNSKTALKRARLSAALVFAGGIAFSGISFFAFSKGKMIALIILALLAAISFVLFITANKRTENKLSVQLSKRDFDAAVRNLLTFDDDYLKKSPTELDEILNSHLSHAESLLSSALGAFGATDIEQVKAKSPGFKAENIKEITDELAIQKEEFIALSCSIKHCTNFSSAKILYVELCESLLKLKSINEEIKSISLATGIENTDEEFVSNKIKVLAESIQNAPILPAENTSSIPEIRKELSEKRIQLNQLQSQLKRPDTTLSELLLKIKETEYVIENLTQRSEEIDIAIECLNEAILDTGKGLGSKLSERVGHYISKISGGRYTDVLVPRDLNLETRDKTSPMFHEWKYLSCGAIDKIYLGLRLAMTDIIAQSHGSLPLFLDDILAQYDDKSAETALKFLKEYIESSNNVSQILFFTCHKNILDMAKNVFSDINEITL